ncbi:MAG: hypothetical protein SPK23_06350 [Eubacteriales bacterium]|nr:hypothetical protein [Eubacteriales bacterium]
MNIKEQLFVLQDNSYADFQARLTPNIPRDLFIGVRVPEARKLAKELVKEAETSEFLSDLPHTYYDENIFHFTHDNTKSPRKQAHYAEPQRALEVT